MVQNNMMISHSFQYDLFMGREVSPIDDRIISYVVLDLHSGDIRNYFHLEEICDELVDSLKKDATPLLHIGVGLVPVGSPPCSDLLNKIFECLESYLPEDFTKDEFPKYRNNSDFAMNKFVSFSKNELYKLEKLYFKKTDVGTFLNPFLKYESN